MAGPQGAASLFETPRRDLPFHLSSRSSSSTVFLSDIWLIATTFNSSHIFYLKSISAIAKHLDLAWRFPGSFAVHWVERSFHLLSLLLAAGTLAKSRCSRLLSLDWSRLGIRNSSQIAQAPRVSRLGMIWLNRMVFRNYLFRFLFGLSDDYFFLSSSQSIFTLNLFFICSIFANLLL